MNNFNDKIKTLMLFASEFGDFKNKLDSDLAKLKSELHVLQRESKEDDSAARDSQILERLNALDSLSKQFDSLRRGSAEHVENLRVDMQQQIKTLDNSELISSLFERLDALTGEFKALEIPEFKSYDNEILALKKSIEKLGNVKIPVDNTSKINGLASEVEKLKSVKPVTPKNYDGDIKALKELVAKIPTPKNYDSEIAAIKKAIEKLSNAKPQTQEVKKSDFDRAIKSLTKSITDLKASNQNDEVKKELLQVKAENAKLNKALDSLSSDFKTFKQAFEG